MALSDYDKMMLSPEDQKTVENAQSMWLNAPDNETRESLHNMVESIRSKYGYSGGTSGNQFIATSNFVNSQIPQMGTYTSPYADMISNSLSSILDRESFSYDPENDEAYQAFLTNVNKIAKTTFADTIAGTSVGTGGRPNSWASTVASNAMGDVLSQGASAMGDYRNIAYQEYMNNAQLDMNKLEALMGLDNVAYSQFIDSYNAEVTSYNFALQQKATDLTNALERTKMTGYVSNADSLIIGLPAGTPSYEAMERSWAMEDYLEQMKISEIYSGSGGSYDDDDGNYGNVSSYDEDTVYNIMKNAFGTKDGAIGGTEKQRAEKLYELYANQLITYPDYKQYLIKYNTKEEASTVKVDSNGSVVYTEGADGELEPVEIDYNAGNSSMSKEVQTIITEFERITRGKTPTESQIDQFKAYVDRNDFTQFEINEALSYLGLL